MRKKKGKKREKYRKYFKIMLSQFLGKKGSQEGMK